MFFQQNIQDIIRCHSVHTLEVNLRIAHKIILSFCKGVQKKLGYLVIGCVLPHLIFRRTQKLIHTFQTSIVNEQIQNPLKNIRLNLLKMSCQDLRLLHAVTIGKSLLVSLKHALKSLLCTAPAVAMPYISILTHRKYTHYPLALQILYILPHLVQRKRSKLRKLSQGNQRISMPFDMKFNHVCR